MPEHTLRHTLSEVESELAGAKSSLAKAIGAHEIEVRALKARIAVLEAAMRPFAYWAGILDGREEKLENDISMDGYNGPLSMGDLRRAREVLSDKSPIRLVGNWTEKL